MIRAGMREVEIRHGRVWTEAVEINAVWHCNIRCAWCSHASPAQDRSVADPAGVERDLAGLASWMRVEHVRVLGGEPLLHPDLPTLLVGIRRSGITDRVRVLTNGLGLTEVADGFWDLVDEVHISAYPSTEKQLQRSIAQLRSLADASGTGLVVKSFDRFRISYRAPDDDRELTERIYRTCQIANDWRCLTVESGRIYRCPQSAYLDRAGELAPALVAADALRIQDIGAAAEVRDWLVQPSALYSCQRCAGSAGALRPHQQVRRGMPLFEPGPIDFPYLEQLEMDIGADNSCISGEVQLGGSSSHSK
jgi:GTP 3',8-cyclase